MTQSIRDLESYKEMNSLLLLGISHELILIRNKIFEPFGITGKQAMILTYLLFNSDKELTQKDFEIEFSLRPSTINSLLNYLEEGGFITRSVSKTDARSKIVTATDKSRQLFKKILKCDEMQERMIVKDFLQEEQDKLHEYLHRIINNITKEGAI